MQTFYGSQQAKRSSLIPEMLERNQIQSRSDSFRLEMKWKGSRKGIERELLGREWEGYEWKGNGRGMGRECEGKAGEG